MSKGPAEVKKPEAQAHSPQPAAGGAPASHKPHFAPSKGKTREVIAGHCAAVDCKKSDKRFSFCEEHYEWFKFGLIKKTGEPVSDFEKKFEHFQAHQRKVGARKVA